MCVNVSLVHYTLLIAKVCKVFFLLSFTITKTFKLMGMMVSYEKIRNYPHLDFLWM